MDCPKLLDGISLVNRQEGQHHHTRLSAMPAASFEDNHTGTNVRTELRRGCSPRAKWADLSVIAASNVIRVTSKAFRTVATSARLTVPLAPIVVTGPLSDVSAAGRNNQRRSPQHLRRQCRRAGRGCSKAPDTTRPMRGRLGVGA